MKKLMVTFPHSGEQIPDLCWWLKRQTQTTLLTDVDRFVDQLYAPALSELGLEAVYTPWHRYAVDLNRVPEDTDSQSLEGSMNAAGKFAHGFHWVATMKGEVLLPKPLTLDEHRELTKLVYVPFHSAISRLLASCPFHLDLHSMPSVGSSDHRDPGELRADVVVSDSLGKSACADFVEAVALAFLREGFKVAYNWPYYGGRITEAYGIPATGHQCLQIELNRSLYMNETTFVKIEPQFSKLQERLTRALRRVVKSIETIPLKLGD